MAIEGPRPAAKKELPALVELANSIFRPNREASMGEEFPLLFHEDNAEGLLVFASEGRPVSMVGTFVRDVILYGTRHRACAIGAVCTDPAWRGQGLATRLMEEARSRALAAGADLMLISGGRGLYTRLGYVDVGGYVQYSIPREALRAEPSLRLRRWTPRDVPLLVALHSAEPVRWCREPEDFLALLQCERVMDGLADTRLIEQAGEAVAYISCRRPGARNLEPGTLSVDEMAGSRYAVAGALAALADEYGVKKVVLNCLECDLEMRTLAGSLGWAGQPRSFHGTVGILDPVRFWEACAPLFAEKLGERRFQRLGLSADGGPIMLSYRHERLEVGGMSEFTRMVFLPRARRQELAVPLAEGSELRAILDELFPLPLVDYGLNFK